MMAQRHERTDHLQNEQGSVRLQDSALLLNTVTATQNLIIGTVQ